MDNHLAIIMRTRLLQPCNVLNTLHEMLQPCHNLVTTIQGCIAKLLQPLIFHNLLWDSYVTSDCTTK